MKFWEELDDGGNSWRFLRLPGSPGFRSCLNCCSNRNLLNALWILVAAAWALILPPYFRSRHYKRFQNHRERLKPVKTKKLFPELKQGNCNWTYLNFCPSYFIWYFIRSKHPTWTSRNEDTSWLSFVHWRIHLSISGCYFIVTPCISFQLLRVVTSQHSYFPREAYHIWMLIGMARNRVA